MQNWMGSAAPFMQILVSYQLSAHRDVCDLFDRLFLLKFYGISSSIFLWPAEAFGLRANYHGNIFL